MTKADIVQAVYAQLGGFSKKEAAELVDQIFDTMKETLGRGEKIKISGFGNFVLRDKRQRQGRNPQTGEPIIITARRVLNFKASQLLKQALNDEEPTPLGAGPNGPGVSTGYTYGQPAGYPEPRAGGYGPPAGGYPGAHASGDAGSNKYPQPGATPGAGPGSGQPSGTEDDPLRGGG